MVKLFMNQNTFSIKRVIMYLPKYCLIKLLSMKKLFASAVLCLAGFIASGQFVYKIKADSVLITNDSCNAELIIENRN